MNTHTRRGFSLVELLVATALVVFVMAILSEAFVAGLDSFRLLKAQGEMQERLRVAVGTVRADLRADHFIGNGPRLSDQDLSKQLPPDWGFFRLWQGSPPAASTVANYQLEGVDGDGIPSYRATDHLIHFTRKGKDRRWSQVVYFLRSNNSTAGTTPLYALYRREDQIPSSAVMMAPTRDVTLPFAAVDANTGQSLGALFGRLYSQPVLGTVSGAQFALPTGTKGIDPTSFLYGVPNASPLGTGDDLLLTDVLSFEVQVLTPQESALQADYTQAANRFVNLFDRSLDGYRSQLPGFYYPSWLTAQVQGLPSNDLGPAMFDTWSKSSLAITGGGAVTFGQSNVLSAGTVPVPLRIRVQAIQITIRVWDDKTKQARQITFTQEM